jgi:cytidine deaminase
MKVLLCGKEEAYLVPSATALLPFCFSKSDLI